MTTPNPLNTRLDGSGTDTDPVNTMPTGPLSARPVVANVLVTPAAVISEIVLFPSLVTNRLPLSSKVNPVGALNDTPDVLYCVSEPFDRFTSKILFWLAS